MKRVILFLIMSTIVSPSLFSMDEKQRLECLLKEATTLLHDLKVEYSQEEGSDLTESERAIVYGEYDSSRTDRFLAEMEQLNRKPTEEEIDEALKQKEMEELVDDIIDQAWQQGKQNQVRNAEIDGIIRDFEIVDKSEEEVSKPFIFKESDGTEIYISPAWLK